MKFRFAFDGDDDIEVVTVDTEIDYGLVSESAFELIDSVRPTNDEILIRAGEGSPVHINNDEK